MVLVFAVILTGVASADQKFLEKTLYNALLKRYSVEKPKAVFENFWSLVYTVIFGKGKCLKEINSLSDAIIHCRSGCGKDVWAGPKLIAEMREDDALEEYMFTANSKIQAITTQNLQNLKWGETKGKTIVTDGSKCFSCQTLGGYCGRMNVSVNYQCQYSNDARNCQFDAMAMFSGYDIWDFETHPEWPWWENLVREIIPEWLVSWRGQMKVFHACFNLTRSFSGNFQQGRPNLDWY